jgi:hypothetical protein
VRLWYDLHGFSFLDMRARGRADLLMLRDPILTVDLDLEDIFFFDMIEKERKKI